MNSLPIIEPIRLNYKRIYILPTRQGLGLVMLMVLLLLIAFVYNNNLVYLLSFLLASLFFITILHTVKSLEGLVIRKGNSADIFAGEFAEGTLVIENLSNTARYSVLLEGEKGNSQIVDIPARQNTIVSLSQKTDKRGWFIARSPTISSSYPFGLFRAWNRLNIELKTLVYPQPVTQNCPLPENNLGNSAQGNAQKGEDDFYGLNSYQEGDNIKRIHWRTFANAENQGNGAIAK